MIRGRILVLAACAAAVGGVTFAPAAEWDLAHMVTRDKDGRPTYHARPIEAKFRNTWPADLEAEFQKRAGHIIAEQAKVKVNPGNTYFENEKRTYGYLMSQALAAQGLTAVQDLQREDAQRDEWHRETAGIDFYAAFTLKHQMRKYFYFGDLLAPDYRRRMFDGGKAWTAQDPLRRPHYTFKAPKEGWGPDARNSWVDVRSTENLFLMRVTSVYLMAEETGNRETAAQYKQLILDYAKTLYRIGMGEWDSENYHGHSLAPLANLYDFAKDDEVQLAAKACLDWMYTAGAVKYWRGGFNGPTKRDYNHAQPFGGSAPCMLWVLFGDSPRPNEHWESDEVHLITSAYRPPVAVVNLARKQFAKPLELFAAKPSYSATTSLQAGSAPEYLETQYFGHSYQMGSLSGGTTPGVSDVNGFKILVFDKEHGARALQVVPGPDPEYPGSPQYQTGKVLAENRVGQYRNLAVWLAKDGSSPWRWVIPQSARVSVKNRVNFLECEKTWVAIHALGTGELTRDDGLTAKISGGEKAKFPGHQVLAAAGKGGSFCGLAIEVGEAQSHGSFEKFQAAALAAKIDTTKLAEGVVQFQAADGTWLGFNWQDNAQNLGVWRNGQRHDFADHARYLYRSSPTGEIVGPIHQAWGQGTLYVEAGGEAFACTVAENGTVSFCGGPPSEVRAFLTPPTAAGPAK
ncbi:MAG: hypothetical protein SFU86_15345 [Pirellulaceae bacterium]|nr:hypothetical protein [Pirellulaceae bacterium]